MQFIAQLKARIDTGQHQAQLLGQCGHQLFAFIAQDSQRLLHGHARFEQDAQQRNEGGDFHRQFFLPMVRSSGQQTLGQQITDTQGERRD
ncbi:hypothetical protein D3C76_1545750 [compost metagenome]